MKVYFVSALPAALKLDGEYAGIIDCFERFCDIDCKKGTLAEIVPGGNLQPINFFIDEEFFKNPPDCAEVYISGQERIIKISGYMGKDACLKMLLQTAFCGITVTVYRQGGYFVSCEGKDFEVYPLPCDYENARAEEITAGGKKLLALYGGRWLTLINPRSKLIFMNEVESCSLGGTIEIKAPLVTCSNSFAECVFAFDGENITAVNSRTIERAPQDIGLLPFVFFERVLCCGDYAALLCPELQAKAGSLKKYLGDFTGVAVPTAAFYAQHPNENAAGLVFKKKPSLYEILYFAVDAENGRITNIRPV